MLIAFPTLQTICNKSGYSKPTVIKSIKRLEDAHYLQIIPRIGTSNAYKFNSYIYFEQFSIKFLDNK